MRSIALSALFAAVLAAAAQAAPYQIDFTHYFRSAAIERQDRAAALKQSADFIKQVAAPPSSADALLARLNRFDRLVKRLQRHDIYVYLRSEENRNDHADADADSALGDTMDSAESALDAMLGRVGAAQLDHWMAASPALAQYRTYIGTSLAHADHASRDPQAERMIGPALDSLSDSYKTLRPSIAPSVVTATTDAKARAAFIAQWLPFVQKKQVLASLLTPIIHLRNGEAKLRGFSDAPAQAYFNDGLTPAEVDSMLAAVRKSDANKTYIGVVAGQAARRLHMPLADLHVWDLDMADSYQPGPVLFPAAIPLILAAEKPMGAEYAGQYERLLAPNGGRTDWCHTALCDQTGFSVGFAGSLSALFYGSYRGTTDNIRAVAHESGHAVHREFMSENQKLAVYNGGPHFLMESVAIFNGFLLEDYLYRTAATPAAKAYYLHRFINDAAFNVFGSAEETDLEQTLYRGVAAGTLHDAADFDAGTAKVFARYAPPQAFAPQMKDYWAHDTLYFTDPLYDVNYLFAGTLALEYWRQYEADPAGFSRRYVALLKNGFTDTPQVLEKRFLGIDMRKPGPLVADATGVIARRTAKLAKLYATCEDACRAK